MARKEKEKNTKLSQYAVHSYSDYSDSDEYEYGNSGFVASNGKTYSDYNDYYESDDFDEDCRD